MKHLKLYEELLSIYDLLPKIIDFIGVNKLYTYFHTTTDEEICKNIMDNGFEYVESISNNADYVTSDIADVRYKMMIRQRYGKYIIIIQSKHSITEDSDHIKKPFYDEERDGMVYTLHPKYIRGYINTKTFEIINNPKFNI